MYVNALCSRGIDSSSELPVQVHCFNISTLLCGWWDPTLAYTHIHAYKIQVRGMTTIVNTFFLLDAMAWKGAKNSARFTLEWNAPEFLSAATEATCTSNCCRCCGLLLLIWVYFGQHTAANFGQYEYQDHVPARSTIALVKMPYEDTWEKTWENFNGPPQRGGTAPISLPSISIAKYGILSSRIFLHWSQKRNNGNYRSTAACETI